MFACYGAGTPSYVTALNLSGWDFSKVTTMNRMFDRCGSAVITFPTHTELNNLEDILYMFSHCYVMTPTRLTPVIKSWDFSSHVNVPAVTALFATCDDNNHEVAPSNELYLTDMNDYKATRQAFDTHPNNTVIKKLYLGGNNLSRVRDRRLTTVETP
jgi:surface protein